MSALIDLLSQKGGRRPHYVPTRHVAMNDLLQNGHVFTNTPPLDGEEEDRFERLVQCEELQLAGDCFREEMETYLDGDITSDQYVILLAARFAAVKQQQLILRAADGKVVLVHTAPEVDDIYVRPDYTGRIRELEERIVSLAQDLKSFIDRAAGVTG